MLPYGSRFQGFSREGFAGFAIRDRDERRAEIVRSFHPPLELLAADLCDRLNRRATIPLHAHLPRLDWPPGYQPFCTWLALSRETHGYQAGPQLNVGVHADHVSIRLGWDTTADAFGRFEFLCRHAEPGKDLLRIAAAEELKFRVFASAAWPRGSAMVFESSRDLTGSFDEVRRRGVWWELSRRNELPLALDHVSSAALGDEAARVFDSLLVVYERIAGERP